MNSKSVSLCLTAVKEHVLLLRRKVKMFGVPLLSILLSFFCAFGSATAAQQSAVAQWAVPGHMTTHSPLTAFKQLGFDNNGYRANAGQHVSGGHPQVPSYIPYAISDFSDPPPSVGQKRKLQQKQSKVKNSDSGSAEGFQQIHHPNDILSNMGVDLPSEEILGRSHDLIPSIFARERKKL